MLGQPVQEAQKGHAPAGQKGGGNVDTCSGEGRPALLELHGLSVAFGRGRRRVTAVNSVSLTLERGETLGLVGESGSGKTTIGRAILRLVPPTSGTIWFDGMRIDAGVSREQHRTLTRRIQMVFQDPMSSLNERAKVGYIVSEGLYRFPLTAAQRREAAAEALRSVGMPAESMNRFPHEFSGGQRQRIGLARALAVRPDLIVADEPVSALDVSVRAQILNLFRSLSECSGLAILFISHDLSVVRWLADRVAVIYAGRIVETAPTEELFRHPCHPYTRALLASIPAADPRRRHISLPPFRPGPEQGCALREISPGHLVFCTPQAYDRLRTI